MKTFLFLSAVLIAANVFIARHWLAGRHPAEVTTAAAPSVSHTVENHAIASERNGVAAARSPSHEKLAALAADLRRSGLSDAMVRKWLGAEIDELYRARKEALQPPWKKTRFWQQEPLIPLATRLALVELEQEKNNLKEDILGYDPSLPENAPYRFLPSEKQETVKRINEEYSAVIAAHRTNAGYMPTEAETAEIRKAEATRKRELGALLSEEEQLSLEMRTALLPRQPRGFSQAYLEPLDSTAPTALRLAEQLQYFDSTETEFRAIYQMARVLEPMRRSIMGEPQPTIEAALQLSKLEPILNEQLKATLGSDRYAAYLRAGEYEFRRVGDFVQRLALPIGTTAGMFGVRDSLQVESRRVFDDASMDVDQKRAALKALANEGKERIRTLLGVDGSVVSNAVWNRWTSELEAGQIRIPIPGENGTTVQRIDRPLPAFWRTAPGTPAAP